MKTLVCAAPEDGSKAYNLKRLIDGHFRVPKGAVLGVTDAPSASNMWALLNYANAPHVAIRSSAAGEDGVAASFAGQHDTVLNVPGKNVAAAREAVGQVRKSASKSAEYRKTHGLRAIVSMPVIVQAMVADPIASGVMFTADPETQRTDHTVIEWVEGLGDKLVSGEVNPAGRATLDKNGYAIDYSGQPFDWDYRGLYQYGQQIVKLFNGVPQDIEWCFNAEGFWFVQARPLTGVSWSIDKTGRAVTEGVAVGTGHWLMKASRSTRFRKGNVLLTRMTSPHMVGLMRKASGIATEIGGRTCHAAIVARELGKPCVVGVGDGLNTLHKQTVTVDGVKGEVRATITAQ